MTNTLTEAEEKIAFALHLLTTPNEPFKAALAVFPNNTARALWVANHWPSDPEVMAARKKHVDEGGEFTGLPGKAELARNIWDKMQGQRLNNGQVLEPEPEDYVKLAKLYAEVRGFIEKPNNNTNVTLNVPRVVEVPAFQSAADWEAAAAQQQRELLDNARTRH